MAGRLLSRFNALPRQDRRAGWILIVLGFVGLAIFLTQTPLDARHEDWRGPHVTSDGWYYYHGLRSIALDGDLDFENEYRDFGNWYGFDRGHSGRPRNPFGVGPAVAWLPGFAIGHWISKLADHDDEWRKPHGYSPPEQIGSLLISYLAGWATMVLTYAFARRWFDPLPAALGSIGTTLGGPLLWYAVYEPSMPHALAALTASVFVALAVPFRHRGIAGWAVLGCTAGLAMLMRPQHGVLLLLPALQLGREVVARGGGTGPLRTAAVRGTVMLAGATATFLPQLLAWNAIYDQWFVVPQGSGFLRWGESMFTEVLFSSRNGLFPSTPILWLCLPGLALWARRDRFGAAALAAFLLSQAYINGAAWDWWAGGAYGGRRMLGSSFLYGVAVAACFNALLAGRRQRHLKRTIAIACLAVFVVPQLFVVAGYKSKTIRLDDPSPVPLKYAPALGHRLGRRVERVFDRFGNPFAFPANAVFALQYGVPLSRYDHVVGPYLLNERVPTTNPLRPAMSTDEARLAQPDGLAFAGRGVELSNTAARIEDRGTLLVPLNRPGELKATLSLFCTEPTTGSVSWRGEPGLTFDAAPPGRRISVEVPAADVVRGINELIVEVDHPVLIKHLLLTEGDDWPPPWTKNTP